MFFSEMNASKNIYIVGYKTRYAARRIPITKLVVNITFCILYELAFCHVIRQSVIGESQLKLQLYII